MDPFFFLESDFELEGLVPEESDANLDLLSIEPDRKLLLDEKQSLGISIPINFKMIMFLTVTKL